MLASLVPAEVVVAEVFDDRYDDAELLAPERAALDGAGPKRRREFTAVRICAREALARAGLPLVPIVPGPSGAPLWPAGVVGAMTHCEGYRGCAIGRSETVAAIGIDAEPDAELPDGVLAMVASQPEQAALADLRRSAPGHCWDRILFSAKESVFKAWFPATGRWLGFLQASVAIDAAGTFTARLGVPGPVVGGKPVTAYHGRWLVSGGLIVTAVTVPAGRVSGPSH